MAISVSEIVITMLIEKAIEVGTKNIVKAIKEDDSDGILTILRTSLENTKTEFGSHYPGVEIQSEDGLYNSIFQLAFKLQKQGTSYELSLELTEIVYSNSFIHHPNSDTKKACCSKFAEIFSRNILAEFAKRPEFNARIAANESFEQSRFQYNTSKDLEFIKDGIGQLLSSQQKESKTNLSFESKPFEGQIFSAPEPIELSEKVDAEISGLYSHFFEQVNNFEPIDEQIKTIETIVTKLPPNCDVNIQQRIFSSYMSCFLRGGTDYWSKGLLVYDQWTMSKSKYSRVVLAALKCNLGKFHEALKEIEAVSQSDVFTFSDQHKNSYYQIYALIKINLKDREEAKKLIEKCPDKKTDDYFMVYFQIHAYEGTNEAFSKATEALNNPSESIRVVRSAASHLIGRFNYLQGQYGNGLEALAELKPNLEVAYKRALEIIRDDKIKDRSTVSEFVELLPILAKLVGKSNEVLDLLDGEISKRTGSFSFLYNSASCFLDQGLSAKALKCFELSNLTEIIEFQGMDIYVHVLILNNRTDLIKSDFEKISKMPLSLEQKIECQLKFAIEFDKKLFSQLALEASSKFSEQLWARMAQAQSYIFAEEYDKAIEIFEKMRSEPKNKMMGSVNIAKLYATKLKKPETAIEYYKEIIISTTPVQEKIEFVNCLMRLKRFNEVIEKVDEYDKDSLNPTLQNLKGYACIEIGQLKVAKEILGKFVNYQKDDFNYQYNYAILCQRLGDDESLVECLENAIAIKADDYWCRCYLSQGYFRLKRYKEAVVHARFALLGDFSVEHFHVNFINIHRVASMMCPNDQFLNSEELGQLHADVLNKFPERFPESKTLTRVTIPTDSNGNLDITFFQKLAADRNNWLRSALDMYKSNGLPISILKNWLGMNSHEIWSYFLQNTDKDGFYISARSFEFLRQDLTMILSGKKILLDNYALFTLKTFDLLDVLLKLDKKIVIGSKSVIELQKIKHRLASSADGHMTMGVDNGKFVKELVTSEKIAKVSQFIEGLISFVTDNCEILSVPNESIGDEDIESALDEESIENWLLDSKYPEIVSIWTDGHLVNISNSVGKKIVSMQSLFITLVHNKLISDQQYADMICQLTILNFRGLVFTADVAAVFIAKANKEAAKELVSRLLSEKMFTSEDGRITFLADLIIFLEGRQYDTAWILDDISPYLTGSALNGELRFLFGVFLYVQAIRLRLDLTVVDKIITKMSLKGMAEELLLPRHFRTYLAEALKKNKAEEYAQISEEFGLNKK